MRRWIFITALAVAGLATQVGPLSAQRQRQASPLKPKDALRRMAAAMPAELLRAPQSRAVRGPFYTLVNDGESVILDNNGNQEFDRFDEFIGNGTIFDERGGIRGSWEGRVLDSSEPTYFLNLTLRLAGIGTATINGAGYTDGLRTAVAAVPVVGITGRVRIAPNVGVGLDDDGNFVLAMGGVR